MSKPATVTMIPESNRLLVIPSLYKKLNRALKNINPPLIKRRNPKK